MYPAITFLGCESPLAAATLRSLNAANVAVHTVLIAAPEPAPADDGPFRLRVTGQRELEDAATDAGIPVRFTGEDSNQAIARALGESCEILLVACLATILSADVLARVRHFALNVHPSPLPAYRGPAPMFWQLREGARQSAVTVHRITPAIDAGAVLAQADFQLPDGINEIAAEALAGDRAGPALADALASWPDLAWHAQAEAAADYQGQPKSSDYRIDADTWSVARAFNFVSGTQWRGMPYVVRATGWTAHIHGATEAQHEPDPDARRDPVADGQTLYLPFPDGTLVALGELRLLA